MVGRRFLWSLNPTRSLESVFHLARPSVNVRDEQVRRQSPLESWRMLQIKAQQLAARPPATSSPVPFLSAYLKKSSKTEKRKKVTKETLSGAPAGSSQADSQRQPGTNGGQGAVARQLLETRTPAWRPSALHLGGPEGLCPPDTEARPRGRWSLYECPGAAVTMATDRGA